MKSIIDAYLKINILNRKLNCPYWSNKLKDGKVVVRGFANGKGSAVEISQQLNILIEAQKDKEVIVNNIAEFNKFAKRNRVGIDCSGLVYRILDYISGNRMAEIFTGGINKTNADRLTSMEKALPISKLREAKIGDLIRINNGKHVALITDISPDTITYIHTSSRLTFIKGVHPGEIKIRNLDAGLGQQEWLELTAEGENFGRKYFQENRGDGVFRLKIF